MKRYAWVAMRAARIIPISIAALLLFDPNLARAAPGPELRALASQLVQSGGIRLTGDITCESGPGNGTFGEIHTGSDAAALLEVAEHRSIYLYAHGFYTYPRRTKPPLSYAQDTWKGHLAVVRNLGSPYVACLFITDTARGFGDGQTLIGDFLFALRALTDDPDLYDPKREIVAVGYSAGANYVKQSLVTYQKYLRANGVEPAGIEPTRMTWVFLGGVHTGTGASDLANAGIQLLNAIQRSNEKEARGADANFEQRWREYLRSEREALTGSRGAQQLQVGNPELAELNLAFKQALTANIRVINLVSTTDIVAPPSAATLPFVPSVLLDGLSHSDFVGPPTEKLQQVTARIYRR